MKKIIVFTFALFFGISIMAQETFFPTTEGTVLVYKNFDKKDKETGQIKYTIKDVVQNGTDLDITYQFETTGPKGEDVFSEEITVQQRGDKLIMDMGKLVNKAAFQQDGQLPAEVEITGNNMEFPVNAQVGETLPDANVLMEMKLGFVKMKMGANVTNRKLEAIENVTVAGGTFEAYKFTSDVNATVMGVNARSHSVEWYAKGIGMIKTETWDKKGKLEARTELVEKR